MSKGKAPAGLTPAARKVYDAFASDLENERWVRYKDVRDVGPFTLAEICAVWNELRAAGLADGSITTGEPCRVRHAANE